MALNACCTAASSSWSVFVPSATRTAKSLSRRTRCAARARSRRGPLTNCCSLDVITSANSSAITRTIAPVVAFMRIPLRTSRRSEARTSVPMFSLPWMMGSETIMLCWSCEAFFHSPYDANTRPVWSRMAPAMVDGCARTLEMISVPASTSLNITAASLLAATTAASTFKSLSVLRRRLM